MTLKQAQQLSREGFDEAMQEIFFGSTTMH